MRDDTDTEDRAGSRPAAGLGGPVVGGGPSPQNTGAVARGEDLAHRLAGLARDLQRAPASEDVMARSVRAAVALVPGAEEGSISLVHRRRRVTSEGATGDLPVTMDRLQEETGQGPCLDAAFERATVRVRDLATDERWPELARGAAAAGIHGALCLQLFVHGDDLGALNLLSRRPDAFDDESEQVGLLLASHVAVAVAGVLRLQGAGAALAHRDLIGVAKGVLVERFRLTPNQAFALLVEVSQHTNRKLVDLADELVTTGRLP